jgi:ABC-type cobalamin transport system permease subunit
MPMRFYWNVRYTRTDVVGVCSVIVADATMEGAIERVLCSPKCRTVFGGTAPAGIVDAMLAHKDGVYPRGALD